MNWKKSSFRPITCFTTRNGDPQEQGVVAPTRGTVRDIGPGVTHKHKAVELWLSGKEALEAARRLNHSLTAVERDIQTFSRVVYAQRKMRNMLKTARDTRHSPEAVARYVQDYRRISACLGMGMSLQETSFATHLSARLVAQYNELTQQYAILINL